MKILHVEDEEPVFRAVKRMLSIMGHTSDNIPNMTSLPQDLSPWDLIITDGQFPGGNGLQVAELALKQLKTCIIYSGCSELKAAVEARGFIFVDKAEPETLKKVIEGIAAVRITDRPLSFGVSAVGAYPSGKQG